jgi:hypothetical protein
MWSRTATQRSKTDEIGVEGCETWWTQSMKCSTVLSNKKLPEGIMALELLQLAYRGKIKLTP